MTVSSVSLLCILEQAVNAECGTWFSGELGNTGLTAELDVKDFFPQLNDSEILFQTSL